MGGENELREIWMRVSLFGKLSAVPTLQVFINLIYVSKGYVCSYVHTYVLRHEQMLQHTNVH